MTKRRPERIALRVEKGVLLPADDLSLSRLRARGYHRGDIVFAEIKKPRNPRFHGMAHVFGRMLAENVDEFTGMDPHAVLKRLQLETGHGCEECAYLLKGHGMIVQRIPRSLSFESMDQGDFKELMRAFSRHVSETYWPSLSPEQIEDMTSVMVGEAA